MTAAWSWADVEGLDGETAAIAQRGSSRSAAHARRMTHRPNGSHAVTLGQRDIEIAAQVRAQRSVAAISINLACSSTTVRQRMLEMIRVGKL